MLSDTLNGTYTARRAPQRGALALTRRLEATMLASYRRHGRQGECEVYRDNHLVRALMARWLQGRQAVQAVMHCLTG